MKKKIISSVIVVFVFAGIFNIYRHRGDLPQTSSVWVGATQVKETSLPVTIRAIGTLAARSVEISAELPGHVKNINFIDGSFVRKNDVLIQLDDAIYATKYESAKARLAFSQNDYQRKNTLGKKGVIAQQAIDQALADLASSKAMLEESRVMVDKMKLIAPFAGMIGKSKVNPGDYVNTGQSLVLLTDTKNLRIEYSIPESWLPLVKLGQKVSITAAAYPDKKFVGKVTFISPTINIENRSISLYAEIPNPNNELLAGMFVTIRQTLSHQERVIMIPARSLVPVLDGEQVYKVVEGKAYAVSVNIGQRKGDQVQITSGLKIGDSIITDGQLKVSNGMPVQIKT